MEKVRESIHLGLRNLSDNNKLVYLIYLLYRFIQFKTQSILVKIKMKFREKGKENKNYSKIIQFRNIHKGKRCFVLATGPSLNEDDINKLKNEYTFGMNSICLIYDKTDWRPTYFAIQDNEVFAKLQYIIKKYKEVPVFISDNIKKKYRKRKDWILFPTDTKYHSYEILKGKYFAKFSDDSYRIVYDGYSIAYSILQLAVYMGFKEIYLLGADCTYTGGKEHFVDAGVEDRSRIYATPKLVTAYEAAKKFADNHDIKIFNATRGGVLEVFPRVNLDEVLNLDNKAHENK